MPHPTDPLTALVLLTRIPAPGARPERAAAAAWAWPLAGMVPAVLAAGLIALAGAPPAVSAGLALTVLVVTTGALHEDGLADTADGLWGGWDRDRRLAIMKDSHLGAYGAIALVLSLGLRAAALSAILATGALWLPLIATALLSRAAMLGVATALPHARSTGLSRHTGRPRFATAGGGIVLALLIALPLVGPAPCLAAGGAAIASGAIARAKIGGQTGDILGATQQVAEIAVLIALAA